MLLLGLLAAGLGIACMWSATHWAAPHLTEEARTQLTRWGGGVHLMTSAYVPEARHVAAVVILAHAVALSLFGVAFILIVNSR